MTKDDEIPESDPRLERKQRRLDAQLLAALYSADDAELARFRKQRLGRDSDVSDERLGRARDVLDLLVTLLHQDEDATWKRFDDAYTRFRRNMGPSGTERPLDSESGDEFDDDDGDRPTTPPAPPARAQSGDQQWAAQAAMAPQNPALAALTAQQQAAQQHAAQQHAALHAQQVANQQAAQQQAALQAQQMAAQQAVAQQVAAQQAAAHQAAAQQAAQHAAAQQAAHQAAQQAAAHQAAQAQWAQQQAAQNWGQAYAPGSVPIPPHMPIPPHLARAPSMGAAPTGTIPSMPAVTLPSGAPSAGPVSAVGPPSSQQPREYATEIYDASFAETHTREPTPPLFEAPAESSKTPVAGTILDDDEPPPESRTDPHTPAPPPSPLPPSPRDEGYTAELSLSSHAHAYALTVDEYAAFCAERDLCDPGKVRKVEKRYDVTSEARESLERVYQLRFERDPALRTRWQQAYLRYSTILRQREQSVAREHDEGNKGAPPPRER